MRNIHYFHILCDGQTLRELDEKLYMKLIHDERLQLGWIDQETFWLSKGGISKLMLLRILRLGGWIM
jgi:hypothetical protein